MICIGFISHKNQAENSVKILLRLPNNIVTTGNISKQFSDKTLEF